MPRKISYPPELPISQRRDELLATIRDHQVVVVAGETGSGKSTQLPKLCLELGRGEDKLIGHTQPRRIAARSIAERVASELNDTVGGLVGYKVRFTDEVGHATAIKLMTDGILLAEIQRDRDLSRYDTIIIDEAHERSLNVDFLLGYLRTLLDRRPDLKLIITSATIDTEKFALHFADAPVVEVSGRTYPVEVRYRPLDDPERGSRDQPQGICDAVRELVREGPGDILVFCSGEREIRDAAESLEELALPETEVLRLYGRLSAAEQHRVFQSHAGRRIVVATNVAETSLTVPGIRSVVDPGTARISRFNRRTKVQRLPIEPVSQASANQRAGRCGRIGAGVCIRLYDEEDFDERPEFTDPEIQRTNLASVILQMAALGLGDVESFPFVDPPDNRAIRDGINLLGELDAVDPEHEGTTRWLTRTGRKLARVPADPRLARMLLEADRNNCLTEVLVIVAALSIQDPRERPTGKEQLAAQAHAEHARPGSDLLGWLDLWDHLRNARRDKSSNQFRKQCKAEYLNHLRVREWQDLHAQLRRVTNELGLHTNREPADEDSIHRSLLAGLLSQIGMKEPEGIEYRGARRARFAINPGSVLFKGKPRWVMAAELVETNRMWARGVARIRPEWCEEVGGHLAKYTYGEPWWDPEQGRAYVEEHVSLFGLPLAAGRKIGLDRVDRSLARKLFIRHALVEGEWDRTDAFLARNAATIAEVEALEVRARRTDLLVGQDRLAAFFDARLGDDVATAKAFERWWAKVRLDRPALLDLTAEDVLDADRSVVDDTAYPTVWHHGDLELAIHYAFEPGSPSDGITVDVPVELLQRIDPGAFEWGIPGTRTELITTLVRSLPKPLRKQLVPVPESVARVMERLDPAGGGLLESLRRELSREIGSQVPIDAFDLERVPSHLRPGFRVIGEGHVIAAGPDLIELRKELGEEVRASLARGGHELERSNIVTWDFGALPRSIETQGAGHTVSAYPALVDEGDSVAIRLLATIDEQTEAMWAGTRRLLQLGVPGPAKAMRPLLTNELQLAMVTSPYAKLGEFVQDVLSCAIDKLLLDGGGPVWDGAEFEELLAQLKPKLNPTVIDVGEAATKVVIAHHQVRGALESLTAPGLEDGAFDLREQLDALVYPGFVTGVGSDRLSDLARYLQAMSYRIERLRENPHRDRTNMVKARQLEAEHARLFASLPWSPELEDLIWMLQELRVSLFAQSIGTRGSVSEQRVRKALTAVARA